MNSFQEKALHTDGQTYGQTRLLRSQRPVGRETKKPLFLGILGKNGPNWAQKGPFSNFLLKSENVTFFPNFLFIFQNKKLENSNAEKQADRERQRERQRRVTIYRSESARTKN